ncbi:MAG: signal peptidase I [Pseudomonadota bacterium]
MVQRIAFATGFDASFEEAAGRWRPSPAAAAALGLAAPPFAYLYLQRPVLAALVFAACLALAPTVLQAPWLWFLVACAAALHAGTSARARPPSVRRFYSRPMGLMLCLWAAVASLGVARAQVLGAYRVGSESMLPNLEVNDLLFVKRWEEVRIARGRVYLLRFPGDEAVYVKRLVGLPGDVVELRGNLLTVNGAAVTRPAPDGGERLPERLGEARYDILDRYGIKPFPRRFELSADEHFFLGDNRSNSIDSRALGVVGRADIIGEASRASAL